MTQSPTTRAPHAGGRPPAIVHNAALLIDFDNVTMGIRSDLQTQLRKLLNSEIIRGKVAVQRAYADWRRYPQYIVPLSESSIDLIFAPAFGANKKNATDIRLAIDALELVFTRPEIGTFILLSGDSDFSSLVLKLKEYGKYVIGVGIRESASDLLVQNCDEYYSYNELTGLAKEAQMDALPRDPWEVAVEAVLRMKEQRDVMRSDRLKQVMQEIDPHFNEKDVGFNKFSKFVTEASRRRLITIEKMENGQYEVDVGPDANVPPASTHEELVTQEDKRRGKPRASAAERSIGDRGMTLATAFQLLKRVLQDLGAVGDEATDHEQVRERMTQLADEQDDPLFEAKRFQRMLRQAHDAHIIDLMKGDDDVYMLKLNPKALESDEAPAEKREGPAERRERPEAKESGSKSRGRRKRGGKKPDAESGTARRSAKPEPETASEEEEDVRAARSASVSDERLPSRPTVAEDEDGEDADQRRNPRFRFGSRVPSRKKVESAPPETEPAPVASPDVHSAGRRSLRGRVGSRGRRSSAGIEGDAVEAPAPQASREVTEASAPAPSPSPPQTSSPEFTAVPDRFAASQETAAPTAENTVGTPRERPQTRERPLREEAAKPPSSAPVEKPADAAQVPEDGGLLRRMTTAFQRAVLGQDDEAN